MIYWVPDFFQRSYLPLSPKSLSLSCKQFNCRPDKQQHPRIPTFFSPTSRSSSLRWRRGTFPNGKPWTERSRTKNSSHWARGASGYHRQWQHHHHWQHHRQHLFHQHHTLHYLCHIHWFQFQQASSNPVLEQRNAITAENHNFLKDVRL